MPYFVQKKDTKFDFVNICKCTYVCLDASLFNMHNLTKLNGHKLCKTFSFIGQTTHTLHF